MRKQSFMSGAARALAAALILTVLCGAHAGASGIFPEIDRLSGTAMPSLSEALGRYPDEETVNLDGGSTEIYRNVTEADLNAFGAYLEGKGAYTEDYRTEGETFSVSIRLEEKAFTLVYDVPEETVRVTYPEGTFNEWLKEAKTRLRAAKELMEKQQPEEAARELVVIPAYSTWAPAVRVLTEEPGLAAAVRTAAFRTPGCYVTFGHYPQTAGGNDNTPIEWLVLEYDAANNRALLLSRYGLDAKEYNTEWTAITWEQCTLRSWLNGEFLNKAFSVSEQGAIETTRVDNSKSEGYSGWDTDGGKNTEDKVFLLSYAEANKYLSVEYWKVSGSDKNTKSRVSPTEYAKKQGAWADSDNKTAEGAGAGWWWLRSPGYDRDLATYVFADGSLSRYVVDHDDGCVRPALWINLESDLLAGNPELKAAAAEAKLRPYKTAGSYVTFGHYPQTAGGNDSTPIEWVVLEYDAANNRALLLSRYGLDAKEYNTERTDITWEKCTLRSWLNGEFLNKAFSAAEQSAIETTTVDNSKSQGYSGWNTDGGKNTEDKVFLLSYKEANKYLKVEEHWSVSGSDKNMKSRVSPTEYAKKQGAFTYSGDRTAEGAAAGVWWLRSPGYYQDRAALVFADGSLDFNLVNFVIAFVRPALWINLNSEIF